MAKRIQANSRESGEALLREWGVASEVGALKGAWGRDPGADAAILERLARLAEPESVATLIELENATADKTLRKEIRRALFRLEQRGLPIPRPEAPPVVVSLAAAEIEGWMSAADGNGDQLFWLVKPRRGELVQLFAVINDPEGMREAELHPVTRKVLRAAREDLLSRHAIRVVEVDWRYCDHRMHEAHRWAVERVAGDYPGLRNQILQDPPAAVAQPILAALDVEAVRADSALLAESMGVLEENELRTWFFPAADIAPYLDEIAQAQTSIVVLSEQQQRERVEQILVRAVEEIFGGNRRESWRRRLLDLAWVFHATQRPERARQTLANALALEDASRGASGVPICEGLLRLSIGAHVRAAAEQEEQRKRESLIVTPQEAAPRRGPR
jgi:hypothetical protein